MIRLAPRFAEFATTTNFSFLRGASHPEELVARAAALGLTGIGIADRNTLAGVVRAHVYARENRRAIGALRVVTGARLSFVDGAPDMLAYPRNRAAYGRLCRLLTKGNLRAPKGECHLNFEDLLEHGEGLQIVAMPPAGKSEGRPLARLREAFPDRLWIGASLTYGEDMRGGLAARAALRARSRRAAARDQRRSHARARASRARRRSRLHPREDDAGGGGAADPSQRRAPSQIRWRNERACSPRRRRRWRRRSASSTAFPSASTTSPTTIPRNCARGSPRPQAALEAFAKAGARARYPQGVPDAVRAALTHELALIGALNYAPYFLTVHDIVRYARTRGILCQGRGSAANSTVCYCLGITEVDPAKFDLLFERFVSPERNEPPDIDVDFEHEKREEVIQYIYARYGRTRAGLASAVTTYRTRSAIRETAKVFGLSDDVIVALNNTAWGHSSTPIGDERARAAGLDPADPTLGAALRLAGELTGFPRHLTQHSGGFVITRDRLDEVAPIMNAAMDDRTTIEWDKDDLDALGILKIDVLALGMLTAMSKSFDLLEKHYGRRLTLASIPSEEACVYAMIQRADTIGVFQIESRAQMSMLPRLKPEKFYDLVIEVAIVRPGPIQGDMVHPYLRRRQGLEEVAYPSPRIGGGARQDARRALVPGAGDEDRHRRGGFLARRGRQIAPRDGDLPPCRHDRDLSDQDGRRHGGQGLRARIRRALLPPDRGLRRIRLSREPRGELRADRLRLVLDEMPLSRRFRRRDAQFAAARLLRARPSWCATRANTASRCARSTSIFPIGIARWRRIPSPLAGEGGPKGRMRGSRRKARLPARPLIRRR